MVRQTRQLPYLNFRSLSISRGGRLCPTIGLPHLTNFVITLLGLPNWLRGNDIGTDAVTDCLLRSFSDLKIQIELHWLVEPKTKKKGTGSDVITPWSPTLPGTNLVSNVKKFFFVSNNYSEVPNRRADWNKGAGLGKNSTLPASLLSKLINEQCGIFCLLHEKLQAGWKENMKNLSEHALLSGTS